MLHFVLNATGYGSTQDILFSSPPTFNRERGGGLVGLLERWPLRERAWLVVLRPDAISINPRRAKRALGSEENSRCSLLIDSEMAGRIRLKLGRMIEDIAENVLAKKFFGSVEVDRGWVGGPQVPLLHHGNDIETPNWACRY